MMDITTFNTGRQYNIKGQRIAATVLDDGRVMFADIDRGLDGITNEAFPYNTRIASVIQSFTMREYDNGRISYGYYNHPDMEKGYALMEQLKAAANAI